jgi:hypothetical protein
MVAIRVIRPTTAAMIAAITSGLILVDELPGDTLGDDTLAGVATMAAIASGTMGAIYCCPRQVAVRSLSLSGSVDLAWRLRVCRVDRQAERLRVSDASIAEGAPNRRGACR